MTTLTLPLWADLHAHFRQGTLLRPLLEDHKKMGCYAVLAMPNTRPPVSTVFGADMAESASSWSAQGYRKMLMEASDNSLEVIVPLYLTRVTTAKMIEEGAEKGALKAVKYYPPHGTTNSESGLPMQELIGSDVLRAMEEQGVIFCIHGEEHALSGADYFDRARNAETLFYQNTLPRLMEAHPRLRIVAEHITTKAAAELVLSAGEQVAATVTPQHLLYTAGDLLQGWLAHLRCMPLVKFEEDRQALRDAVTSSANTRFFAGTDSAPHPRLSKSSDCGCAAGCYTGGVAPQLYAMAFEEAGCRLDTPQGAKAFQRFLCDIGPAYFGLAASQKTFQLSRESSSVAPLTVPGVGDIIPLPIGMSQDHLQNAQAVLPWRITLKG